jgi:hypothetical protein
MNDKETHAAGSTNGPGSRLRRLIGHYRTSLWLLSLAVLLGVVAYVIYPKDGQTGLVPAGFSHPVHAVRAPVRIGLAD